MRSYVLNKCCKLVAKQQFYTSKYYCSKDVPLVTLETLEEEVMGDKKPVSARMLEFRRKLKAKVEIDALPPWPNNTNIYTGEVGGPRGPEPTRYGDWERKGIVTDF